MQVGRLPGSPLLLARLPHPAQLFTRVRSVPATALRMTNSALAAGAGALRGVRVPGRGRGAAMRAVLGRLPATALRTTNTLLAGGGRVLLGLPDSFLRTAGTGGRALAATADSTFRLAGNALERMRQMF